jgi:hypothetical protein
LGNTLTKYLCSPRHLLSVCHPFSFLFMLIRSTCSLYTSCLCWWFLWKKLVSNELVLLLCRNRFFYASLFSSCGRIWTFVHLVWTTGELLLISISELDYISEIFFYRKWNCFIFCLFKPCCLYYWDGNIAFVHLIVVTTGDLLLIFINCWMSGFFYDLELFF